MSSYKDNLQHLPKRLPVRFQWKENKVVKGVLIWHRPYIYLQMEDDMEPKNINHVWNSYLKHHVPRTDSNYKPVSPRWLTQLDLLDLIIYEAPDRVEGQTEPSLKTILTTFAPECVKYLRSAPHDPAPIMPPADIEEERRVLSLFVLGSQRAIDVSYTGSMKAILMPDGTFTYGSRTGLNSFQLLHIYKMDFDPLDDWMIWGRAIDYLYLEGDRGSFTLSARLKQRTLELTARTTAKVELPVPVTQEPSLAILLKTLEERETALKAKLVTLQNTEKERLLAIQEAQARIAQLEADVARLEKALA